MKKFYTFAVVVLMVSLSFGATKNFSSLSIEEMEKEFVNMAPAQWVVTINKAFEAKKGKIINLDEHVDLANILKAATLALNSFNEERALAIIEALDACPYVIVENIFSPGKYTLVTWADDGILIRIECKTSKFAGKTATISKDSFK